MIVGAKVEAKWTNPRIENGKFLVDAEFKCVNDVDRQLAAMNFRAFFNSKHFQIDAGSMAFVDMMPNWKIGAYQTLKGNQGNAASAQLFGFDAPAVYINCAIEGPYFIENAQGSPLLNDWARYFTLSLTPKNYVQGAFAPVLIWDKEQDETRGGFLPNDGLTISLCTSNTNTSANSKYGPCLEDITENLNWVYNGNLTYPFGEVVNTVIL